KLIFVAVSDVAELGEARAIAAPPDRAIHEARRWWQHRQHALRDVAGRTVEQPGKINRGATDALRRADALAELGPAGPSEVGVDQRQRGVLLVPHVPGEARREFADADGGIGSEAGAELRVDAVELRIDDRKGVV